MTKDFTEQLRSALTGSYSIEQELGGGGMSRVYVAEEVSLGRKVVVKVLSPELAGSINAERFKREIGLAARLQHPHIVPLLSAGESNGTSFYTMPLVEGESLRARLSREGALPIADVRRIGRDIAGALAYAHAHGIVHRDIKPENVLLTGDHAVVLDFGVAKAVSAASETGGAVPTLTALGVALGTPAYMSPEQVSADPSADHRADIYSLGVVLYEMLAGQAPFSGRTPQALLAAHATQAPEPIIRLRSSAPPDLATLVMRCLEKTPADRPQTAAEVVQELDRVAVSQPGIASVNTSRTNQFRAIAIVGGLAILAAAVVWKIRSGPRVDPAVSTIAVMPFVSAGVDTALERLGRELVITLAANLDGVNDLRVIDAPTVLSATAAHAGPLSIAEASALAKKLGAQSIVHGSLLRTGGIVRVDAGLYTVDSASTRAKVSVATSIDSIPALTDSLTWSLLRQIWRTRAPPTPSLAAITTHSVPSLRAFLEGERAVSEYNFARAVEAYERAIEADSSFWLAYHRLRTADGWLLRPSDSVVVRKSREHLEAFPERDRRMIEAQAIAKRSERAVEMRKVAEAYPNYWPGWMTYGDRLFHEFVITGSRIDEAKAAFEHVTQLNPSYAAAWEHLSWTSTIAGDTAGAARVLATFAKISSPAARLENGFDMMAPLTATLSAATGGKMPREIHDTLVAWLAPGRLSNAQATFAQGLSVMILPQDAAEIYEKGLTNRPTPALARTLVLARAGVLAQRGDWDSALAALDAQMRVSPDTIYRITALRLAAVGAWLGALAPAEAERRRADLAADIASADPNTRAEASWLDGIIAAAKNDRAGIDAARARVLTVAAPRSDALARSLAAFSMIAGNNRAAARDSLVKLEWERADGPLTLGYVTLVDRLQASRLLTESGNSEEAAKLLRWVDGAYTSMPLLRAMSVGASIVSLERAKIEETLGNREDARRLYTFFLRRFDRPPAPHKHLVTEAEQALARLSNIRDARK